MKTPDELVAIAVADDKTCTVKLAEHLSRTGVERLTPEQATHVKRMVCLAWGAGYSSGLYSSSDALRKLQDDLVFS